MNQREGLFAFGGVLAFLGIVMILYGIEVWTILGTTRYVFTDLANFGIILLIVGIIIVVAGFFSQPDRLKQNYPACPYCRLEIRPEYLKCPRCGGILKKKCTNCGNVVDAREQHCHICGNNQFTDPNQPLSGKIPILR